MYIDWENTQKYDWNDKDLISSIDWKDPEAVDWNASGKAPRANWALTHCKTDVWYKHIDWDDKELVITIVEWDWEDLQYCSARLRDDFDVVMAALSDYGIALLWASDRLKDNDEIVKYAIRRRVYAYEYASKRLQENPEIVELAMKQNPYVYPYIPKSFQADFDYAMAAVKEDWTNYKKVVKNIKGLNKNREIIKAALEQSDEVLNWIPDKVKKYYAFAIDARALPQEETPRQKN
jgi:hypothetical protein